MRRGDKVTIYEDPLTRERPEASATLVRRVIEDTPLEYWRVRIVGKYGTDIVGRWILAEPEG